MVEVGSSQIQTMPLFHFSRLQVVLGRAGGETPQKLRVPNLNSPIRK